MSIEVIGIIALVAIPVIAILLGWRCALIKQRARSKRIIKPPPEDDPKK